MLEPKSEIGDIVTRTALDVLVIPGLAFDHKGNRLGRGLGFFDQLLFHTKGSKIGLAYDFQLLDSVPKCAHDIQMDFIVTNQTVVRC